MGVCFLIYDNINPLLLNILLAVKQLHALGFNHRNLTTSAIYYNDMDSKVKLGHFEHAQPLSNHDN